MSDNHIVKILSCAPINKSAALAVGQAGCAEKYEDLGRDELIVLLQSMSMRAQMLKELLGLDTDTKQKNLRRRVKKYLHSPTLPKFAVEYVNLGQAIAEITRLITQQDYSRHARKVLGAIENEWKEHHPGAVWQGSLLVSPCGEVFSRAAVAGCSH